MKKTEAINILQRRLEVLEGKLSRRSLLTVESRPGAEIVVQGKRVINFASNDYLGLASDGLAVGVSDVPGGAGASRLLAGNLQIFNDCEQLLAVWLGREKTRLFSSGYLANIGAIGALARDGDIVFSDSLNHASIVDGCRLSKARTIVYPHRDVCALAKLIDENPPKPNGLRLVVTESLFSMDGDVAPLKEIAELKERFGFLLMVDEAHSLGAFGPEGRGLCSGMEIDECADIIVGTLGKAFGVAGAFVAGASQIIATLDNFARSFIYSTAPSPLLAPYVTGALQKIQNAGAQREKLKNNAITLRSGLKELGLNVGGAGFSPIIPVILGDNGTALRFSRRLFEKGVLAPAIRPPTVPKNGARIRFSVSAAHSEKQLDKTLRAVADVKNMDG